MKRISAEYVLVQTHGKVGIIIKLTAINARLIILNANGKDNDRNALIVKSSLDREDGVVMEYA